MESEKMVLYHGTRSEKAKEIVDNGEDLYGIEMDNKGYSGTLTTELKDAISFARFKALGKRDFPVVLVFEIPKENLVDFGIMEETTDQQSWGTTFYLKPEDVPEDFLTSALIFKVDLEDGSAKVFRVPREMLTGYIFDGLRGVITHELSAW